MDNKYVVLILILGILIGYIIGKLNSIIRDVSITHPACF